MRIREINAEFLHVFLLIVLGGGSHAKLSTKITAFFNIFDLC